jgi:hypothetical protein
MKIMAAVLLIALSSTVAQAGRTGAWGPDPYDGTGVYSVAEPNCVPAVTALFWYDFGYRFATRNIRERRDEEERSLKDMAPACWLGKVSEHLGLKHRRLYLPSESREIQYWFERNAGR